MFAISRDVNSDPQYPCRQPGILTLRRQTQEYCWGLLATSSGQTSDLQFQWYSLSKGIKWSVFRKIRNINPCPRPHTHTTYENTYKNSCENKCVKYDHTLENLWMSGKYLEGYQRERTWLRTTLLDYLWKRLLQYWWEYMCRHLRKDTFLEVITMGLITKETTWQCFKLSHSNFNLNVFQSTSY